MKDQTMALKALFFHLALLGSFPFSKNCKLQNQALRLLPAWIKSSPTFFGAYLAGLIDGDGDVTIGRRKYPQCKVRIVSKLEAIDLVNDLRKFMHCNINSMYVEKNNTFNDRKFVSRCFITEFKVSSKNAEYLHNFVVPFLKLEHKRIKIVDFVNKKRAASEI